MKEKYTSKNLNEEYDRLTRKIKTSGSEVTPFDIAMGVTAGHALDFSEISKDMSLKCDFSELDAEELNKAIIAYFYFLQKKGESPSGARKTISRKLGCYLVFTVANLIFEKNPDDVDLVVKNKMISVGLSQGAVLIDLESIADRYINKNLKYDPKADTMTIADPEWIVNEIMGVI